MPRWRSAWRHRFFLLTPAPKAQDVTIPGTRGDIYATVQLPGKLARGEELPLVVLCHGFTGSRSGDGHFALLAADLAAQGIATVRLDFPGCGNSTEPFTAYTLSNMTDDVESAITYMQQTYGTGRTALVGHSMGGRLASLYPQRKGRHHGAGAVEPRQRRGPARHGVFEHRRLFRRGSAGR